MLKWQHWTGLESDGNATVGESHVGLRHHAVDVAGDVARGSGKVGGHVELDADAGGGRCIHLEIVRIFFIAFGQT